MISVLNKIQSQYLLPSSKKFMLRKKMKINKEKLRPEWLRRDSKKKKHV